MHHFFNASQKYYFFLYKVYVFLKKIQPQPVVIENVVILCLENG